MQKPSLGLVVHVIGTDGGNGSNRSAAIITRVWSERCINVTIFPDCVPPVFRTSVHLYDTEAEAVQAYAVAKFLTEEAHGGSVSRNNFNVCYAYWPAQD